MCPVVQTLAKANPAKGIPLSGTHLQTSDNPPLKPHFFLSDQCLVRLCSFSMSPTTQSRCSKFHRGSNPTTVPVQVSALAMQLFTSSFFSTAFDRVSVLHHLRSASTNTTSYPDLKFSSPPTSSFSSILLLFPIMRSSATFSRLSIHRFLDHNPFFALPTSHFRLQPCGPSWQGAPAISTLSALCLDCHVELFVRFVC